MGMNKVFIETYGERQDILLWCFANIGTGNAGTTVRDDNKWARSTTFSHQVFTFKNASDATFFKLRWL